MGGCSESRKTLSTSLKSSNTTSSFKGGLRPDLPKVPFEMLTSLALNKEQWKAIAEAASWNQLKKNINTFARHGVFEDEKLTEKLAERLRDSALIRGSKVFPYEIFVAYTTTRDNTAVPTRITNALQDALEISVENVPQFPGNIVVCVDTSGSMNSPVTGQRRGATTTLTCLETAAVFASAILKRNKESRVMLFDTQLHEATLNPSDAIATNAELMSRFGGGGTACQVPLLRLNSEGAKPDLVIYLSDNASWIPSAHYTFSPATEMLGEWTLLKMRNPNAKLVCVDLQPYHSTQALERSDIKNIGGFADSIFTEIKKFVTESESDVRPTSDAAPAHESGWVAEIHALSLPSH